MCVPVYLCLSISIYLYRLSIHLSFIFLSIYLSMYLNMSVRADAGHPLHVAHRRRPGHSPEKARLYGIWGGAVSMALGSGSGRQLGRARERFDCSINTRLCVGGCDQEEGRSGGCSVRADAGRPLHVAHRRGPDHSKLENRDSGPDTRNLKFGTRDSGPNTKPATRNQDPGS